MYYYPSLIGRYLVVLMRDEATRYFVRPHFGKEKWQVSSARTGAEARECTSSIARQLIEGVGNRKCSLMMRWVMA